MTAPRPDLAVVELRDWHREAAIRGATSVRELPAKYQAVAAQEAEQHKRWANALDRLLAERAAHEWQPIETAPKTEKLLGLYRNRQIVMEWHDVQDPRKPAAGWWRSVETGNWVDPIYWLPLTAAPQPPKGPEMSERDYQRAKGVTAGKVTVIDRTRPFDGKCELCGDKSDLRPYGAMGEWICFKCGMKDEATTGKRFMQVVFGGKDD